MFAAIRPPARALQGLRPPERLRRRPPRPVRREPPLAARARLGLTLPSPRVSAVLVLAFLGFGVLLGDAAASRVNDALTASRRDLKLEVGSSTPATASTPSATGSSGPAAEAPESEPEATPGAGETSSTGGSASGASKQSRGPGSGSSSGGSGSGSSKNGSGSGSSGTTPTGSSRGAGSKLPAIQHVFVIMLDDQPYASVFGPESSAHYLADTLESKGALLVRYYAVAHQQLANTIALLTGQGPTEQTAENCPTYEAITPGTIGAQGQVIGNGCVYPARHADAGFAAGRQAPELARIHPGHRRRLRRARSVRAPDAGRQPIRAPRHHRPRASPIATWLNPFVYLGALTGAPACDAEDVGLSQLQPDLSRANTTPDFAYIVPDLCNNGNPTPCAPGAPAGLAPANAFLQQVVPKIMASRAYKENGLLVITVDQAPSSGPFADSSSCCGQPQFPNLPASGNGLAPEGGGQVGALLLSPFIKTHAVSQEPYNHFSLLRTIEDVFGLSHLGYAAGAKVSSFEPSLFSGSG